jgi:hypothetical protein
MSDRQWSHDGRAAKNDLVGIYCGSIMRQGGSLAGYNMPMLLHQEVDPGTLPSEMPSAAFQSPWGR